MVINLIISDFKVEIMEAKLKAKELIESYEKMHFGAGGIGISKKQAVHCAVIAVDEILAELAKNIKIRAVTEVVTSRGFWSNVKDELIDSLD